MSDFYFTFGENHGADRNGFIKITAPSMLDARAAMHKIHGAKWAFCYEEADLNRAFFPKGEMAHFNYNLTGIPELDPVPILIYVNGYAPPQGAYFAVKTKPVPCGLCDKPTEMAGTRRCNRCWELEKRIQADPGIARKILDDIL
jgi:hypothetical protein